MTTPEQARQVLADLKDHLAAAELSKGAMEEKRDALAFNSYTGDQSAKAHLAKITKTLIEHDQHVLSLQAAIRTGEQRVLEAQGVARADIERQQAKQALKLGRAALDALRVADRGLRDAFSALHDANEAINSLNALGCPPSPALFQVNVKRAIAAASMGTRFQVGQHMAPTERRSLTELADGWQRSIENWASQRLDEPAKEAV
jgi:hypothetical protein